MLATLGVADVLTADRSTIGVRSGALECDVRLFDRLVRTGQVGAARAAYGGEFMPGWYDDWAVDERRRLATLFERLDEAVLAAALAVPSSASPPSLASAPAPQRLAAHSPVASSVPPASRRAEIEPLPSGLPHFWTRSMGAELTSSRLSVLVRSHRLVTVHGPGGSGKTRLAVEVAHALCDDTSPELEAMATAQRFDRVAFVPLLDCVDATQTLDAICAALHLEPAVGQAANHQPTRIAAALAGGRSLLLLDNLEQLDAQAGESIAQLLAMAPGLHVLATSRQLLDLNGEQAFELDGLPLPLPGGSAAQASINPAVMLFIDRARAARADFAPDADQLAAVVGLVRLLGGMPLAIELAASRVRTVPPTQLLQRLSEGAGTPMLDLLARGAQRTTAGSRHASMRHVLAYSWRQLSPQQAALMRDLAVLAAPAVPACVAAVAGLALAAAQPLLDSLCDACLLRLLPDERGVLRYSQQQPVREYAAETGNAEHSCAARQRLRLWLTQHLQAANARGYAQLMQAAVPELPQVYAALASAPLDGQGGQAWDLAITLRD